LNAAKFQQLFDLADELYTEQLKASGASVIPYVWAADDSKGHLLVFSAFGVPSNKIRQVLHDADVQGKLMGD